MTTSRKQSTLAFTDLTNHLTDAADRRDILLGLDDHDNPTVYDPAGVPHLAITAPTGAGRSAILRLVIAQALANGTQVILGDPKGGQRWCHHHPNVTYARTPADIHAALMARELYERMQPGAEPGQVPIMVALDDQNFIMSQLKQHNGGGDGVNQYGPVSVVNDILYSGREAGVTLASTATRFDSQTLPTPTALSRLGGGRDGLMAQYGTRLAGPGTSAAGLKLLGGDATTSDAPAHSDVGTFDHLTADTRTRFQAAWITDSQARTWATTRK